jgi:hypothetical protein
MIDEWDLLRLSISSALMKYQDIKKVKDSTNMCWQYTNY